MSVTIRPMTDLSKKDSERLVVLGHESYENIVDELGNLRQQI